MSSLTTAAAEATLEASHLATAKLFLQQTLCGIQGALKGLSEAQWTFKPALDRWSIAENVEHVIIVQERVLGPVRETLAAAPPPVVEYDRETVDKIVIHQFPTRLMKFQAPEPVQPKGDLGRTEALRRLARNTARFAGYLDSTPDLREHAIEAAPLRAITDGAYTVMDGYQWILAAAAHTERHTRQILEVKAEPAFPAQ